MRTGRRYVGRAAGLLLLAALLAGCRTGPKFDPRATSGARELEGLTPVTLTNQFGADWLKPPPELFTLGPGDAIDIEVLGEGSPGTPALVGPDGRIYYQLLPGLDVWGLTLGQTRAKLQSELGKFVREPPQVTVVLRSIASKQVWLLGRMANPGVYPLTAPMTVLEAIALAGGVPTLGGSSEEVADLQRSFLIRGGRSVAVDLKRLLRAGDLSQNIYLRPDDFLYLKSAESRDIFVLGGVLVPNLLPYRPRLTLLSAIATAGGPVKEAYLGHVAIVRGSLSQPSIGVVDLRAIMKGKAPDIFLEPRDIVYVPLSPFRTLYRYTESIVDNVTRSIAVNEGQRAVLRRPAPVGVSIPGAFSIPAPQIINPSSVWPPPGR